MTNTTMSGHLEDPSAIRSVIARFLAGDATAWRGLPAIQEVDLDEALGPAQETSEAMLGWYPARRAVYRLAGVDGPSEVAIYSRDGNVMMAEALTLPQLPPLDALGRPSDIMPHELLATDAYVHEFVYADRGLVLSVAQPFAPDSAWHVVRYRTIRPDTEFGPDLHRSADDNISFELDRGS
jgi:hypothetical protein